MMRGLVVPLIFLCSLCWECARRAPSPAAPEGLTASRPESSPSPPNNGQTNTMELTSSAFKEGAAIPSVYSCDGKNISPPLAWDSVPPATRSLALICDDPDAPNGVFTHWVIYNLPPRTRALPEGVPMGQKTYAQATQAGNDFGNTGYGGPCPPGGTHRYLFQLYALDVAPAPVASKEQLLKAMEGHIVGHAQLMGRYTR